MLDTSAERFSSISKLYPFFWWFFFCILSNTACLVSAWNRVHDIQFRLINHGNAIWITSPSNPHSMMNRFRCWTIRIYDNDNDNDTKCLCQVINMNVHIVGWCCQPWLAGLYYNHIDKIQFWTEWIFLQGKKYALESNDVDCSKFHNYIDVIASGKYWQAHMPTAKYFGKTKFAKQQCDSVNGIENATNAFQFPHAYRYFCTHSMTCLTRVHFHKVKYHLTIIRASNWYKGLSYLIFVFCMHRSQNLFVRVWGDRESVCEFVKQTNGYRKTIKYAHHRCYISLWYRSKRTATALSNQQQFLLPEHGHIFRTSHGFTHTQPIIL